ncbi:hypothetical protein MKW92_051866 [Papaver armeniacum]|nr:hypothetical protein MKW92_051866 [Papaver armeniacum]
MASRALFRRKRLLVDYLYRPACSVEGILNSGYGESSQFLSSRSLSSGLHNTSLHSRPGLLADNNELFTFSTTHFYIPSSFGDGKAGRTDLLSRGISWLSQSLRTASTTKVGQGRSDGFANVTGLSNRKEKQQDATLWVKLRDWLDLTRNHSVLSFLLILLRAFNVSGRTKPEESVQATLSSLPDEVVDTVGMTALPSVDYVSTRTRKLESVKKQDKLIKSVSRERNGFLWLASLSKDRGGGMDCLLGLTRRYSTEVDHPPLAHYVWKPPPRGTVKANTAVSYKKNEWSSIGVVFRDHYGVHDCSLFDTSDGDALDAKYDAIIAAQEFAIERGIKSLIIESDYLHLVNALRNNSDPKLKIFTAKERKIKLLEEQFDYCDYHFIIKEGNSPAKIIAGLKLKERKVFDKPSDIEQIDKREFFISALQADMEGTIYIQKKKLKKILEIDGKLSGWVVS